MLRQSDIRSAFMDSITQNPKGYSCLHTCDFIHDCEAVVFICQEKRLIGGQREIRSTSCTSQRLRGKTASG